ncbi:hypothetical protein HYX13_03570 [Candidatus Woesearchaeota archaeon]|nr:hypothetical protein [Candidatus Woesearchaeota archaeon]
MPSGESEIVQRARKIVRENPEVFRALEEYDRTRKLPKLSYKTRATFTIDADLFRKFRIFCQKEGYAMSKIVEKLVREEIRKKN